MDFPKKEKGAKRVNVLGEIHAVTGLCIMETTKIIGQIVQLPSFTSISKRIIGLKLVSKVIVLT